MAKALGSVFELSIRYLLLLHMSGNKPLTESRLCADDFICTYAADFGLATENLNGSSGYRYGEYASRCSMANEAIRYLVLHGLIKPRATPSWVALHLSSSISQLTFFQDFYNFLPPSICEKWRYGITNLFIFVLNIIVKMRGDVWTTAKII